MVNYDSIPTPQPDNNMSVDSTEKQALIPS